MYKFAIATFAVIFLTATCIAGTLAINPTTTLAAETANNSSAADIFSAQTNGNLGAGNISKLPLRSLLYPGSTTRIYAHYMPWFGSSSHMNVGYRSDDPAQVKRQVEDMISRGIDGAIIDWYGMYHNPADASSILIRQEAEAHSCSPLTADCTTRFEFAITVDKGALSYCGTGCDPTQAFIDQLNYVRDTFVTSPSYMRLYGRPAVFTFDLELRYTFDWARVNAAVADWNPVFIFNHKSGYTRPNSGGAYAWLSSRATDMGVSYLDSFYTEAPLHADMVTVGSAFRGFNDSLAAWAPSPPRIMAAYCGQTWLTTWAEAGKFYSATNQLPNIQLVTWNDYEEGTELETGVDNCLTVSASLTGQALNWTLVGQGLDSTLDHFTVFISTDGQNLMPLADLPSSARSLDLTPYGIDPGSYVFYVKAVGKASFVNRMSNATNDTVVGVTLTTPSDGAVVDSPVHVQASAYASYPIATMKIYLDGLSVYSVSSAAIDARLTIAPGAHRLTAQAWDTTGAYYKKSVNITVNNKPPLAALTLAPTSGPAPLVVNASTAASNDPDGAIASSSIDFGDGTVLSGPAAAHTYTKAGSYTVTATVTDNLNASSATTATVTITNQPPVAVLAVTPATGTAPLAVNASAAGSSDPDGSIASVSIDFGDGTVASGATASHTYPSTGAYTVTATVTDNVGLSSTATATVNVVANRPPVAALSVTPASGVAPLAVTASTAASTDPDGPIASSTINFGDGTVVRGSTSAHTYAAPGTYTVTATVTDNLGASSNATATVTVAAAAAGVTVTSPTNGASVTSPVHVVASAQAARPITQMKIYVDSVSKYATSAASIDTSLAMAAGAHRVTVQAWDTAGTVYKSTLNITVTASANQPPVAKLTVSPTTGTAPLTVTASTTGSTDPDGSIASTSINFGDGAVVNAAGASHTYSAAGTYTVTATVTDNKGASSAATATVLVSAAAYGVKVTTPANGASVTSPVRIVASASSSTPITTMKIYVDNMGKYTVYAASLDTSLAMTAGSHYVVVQAWDQAGKIYKTPLNVTVK